MFWPLRLILYIQEQEKSLPDDLPDFVTACQAALLQLSAAGPLPASRPLPDVRPPSPPEEQTTQRTSHFTNILVPDQDICPPNPMP